MARELLSVENLAVTFHTARGESRAVRDVSFEVGEHETVGLVGESGSGKSVTSLSIMGLLPERNVTASGRILFEGRDLMGLKEREMRSLRGDRLAMIFQEPQSSLNPQHTVGRQIMEPMLIHGRMKKEAAYARALELMRLTGIPAAEKRMRQYSFQMSGGMCQRAMIAMALACSPRLLIADEPTTALDVTVQAQILELLKSLKSGLSASIILITHDLGIVADMCDRVLVMYCGEIVEMNDCAKLFRHPRHPYTRGLMDSVPRIGHHHEALKAIPGTVPTPQEMPAGCAFHPRCPHASGRCREQAPPPAEVDGGMVRCWHVVAEEGI